MIGAPHSAGLGTPISGIGHVKRKGKGKAGAAWEREAAEIGGSCCSGMRGRTPGTGERGAPLPAETKKARISASLCVRGAGTRNETSGIGFSKIGGISLFDYEKGTQIGTSLFRDFGASLDSAKAKAAIGSGGGDELW